ncbi:guanine nucleotide exchange factor [Crucibulum laeve]|uniref:Guanine nucleotide exchange factor n=1 Tax=Crucibulum laeve TaxID=68775 RepID=A0A5C3MD66_9AGAR|nr:guanine nucleotide exchange factor [Crucibulum laeve]
MADILKTYTALSASSPRSDVSDVLNSVINAIPFTFDRTQRVDLIKLLLQDLKNCGPKSRLSIKDAAQALLALKTLGKDPAGSGHLATATGLSTLLSLSTAFKDDTEASSEALRCIANALLLIEPARSTILEKEVNGGEACAVLLEKTNSPDMIFILSRILFLCTVSGPDYVIALVEEKHHGKTFVEIVGSKLDSLTVAILAGTKMARESMSELLKLTYNILMHYPKMVEAEPQTQEALEDEHKVIGDFWSPKLDGLLPPLLRTFTALPPTFPSPISSPLTHVIHALIAVPANPSLRHVWFGIPSSSSRSSASNSPKSPASQSPQRVESSQPSSRSDSPTYSNSPASPKPSTLDRALSVLAAGRRSLSRSPSPNNIPTNVLQRACDLLDVSFSHYFPGDVDPDHPDVRNSIKQETGDSSLDDMLSPLVLLVTKLCLVDDASRAKVRQRLVPEDLDRTHPLEGRGDTLGRCLRLLPCVYHPRLKDAVGEMLYAMADRNASTLSALVGYGNVAGFLFHKGILNAPPQDSGSSNASLTTPSGQAINPVTGTIQQSVPDEPGMTEEEKEREMEKLFVLFNRLERTGALAPEQNPIRNAIQQGKMGI